MSKIAGLQLVERWGGWQKQPYTGPDMHVSTCPRRTENSA